VYPSRLWCSSFLCEAGVVGFLESCADDSAQHSACCFLRAPWVAHVCWCASIVIAPSPRSISNCRDWVFGGGPCLCRPLPFWRIYPAKMYEATEYIFPEQACQLCSYLPEGPLRGRWGTKDAVVRAILRFLSKEDLVSAYTKAIVDPHSKVKRRPELQRKQEPQEQLELGEVDEQSYKLRMNVYVEKSVLGLQNVNWWRLTYIGQATSSPTQHLPNLLIQCQNTPCARPTIVQLVCQKYRLVWVSSRPFLRPTPMVLLIQCGTCSSALCGVQTLTLGAHGWA
jgi:hypothetical protein